MIPKFKFNPDNQVSGYLTEKQDKTIQSLRDVTNGQKVGIPHYYPMYERRLFEENVSANLKTKISLVAMNSFIPSLATYIHFTAGQFPPLWLLLTEVSASALVVVMKGHEYLTEQTKNKAKYKENYIGQMEFYINDIQRGADTAVRKNFIKEVDDVVRAGGAISMDQLAKLVNIKDYLFHDACDRLNVTVLQAKILVQMSKGKTTESEIATYASLKLDENKQEEILLHALKDQFNAAKTIHDENKPEDTSKPNSPTEEIDKKSLFSLKPIFDWFVKGLKGNIDVFRGVSADDYLPPLPESIIVKEIPAIENLGPMIYLYNMKINDEIGAPRRDVLELPALHKWQPKIA